MKYMESLLDSGLEFGASGTPPPLSHRRFQIGQLTTATDDARESSMAASLKFEQRLQWLTLNVRYGSTRVRKQDVSSGYGFLANENERGRTAFVYTQPSTSDQRTILLLV